MGKMIYLDNAATTKISDNVLNAMLPYLTEEYGNPSSIYTLGRNSAIAVNKARHQVAQALGCEDSEVYFTSCGSESDNWAIKSTAKMMALKGKKHIITSVFEHHAVLHTMDSLKKEGFEITYLPVYSNGIVKVEDVANAIRPDTALVTIMYANNEIGTIQPIAEIGRICREKGVLFHTDAVQAAGHIHIDVQAQNIDLLSLSAHKFHGPKGVGALYARRGITLSNLIEGGAQERGKRAGTENTAAVMGMAAALEEAVRNMDANSAKLTALRDRLISGLSQIPHSVLNGDAESRLPGNVSFCFEGIEGEALLLLLDDRGICASSGSACTSGSLDPSHVLLSIGVPEEIGHGSMRFTFGPQNTMEEAKYLCDVLEEVIPRRRAMSCMWLQGQNKARQFSLKGEQ